ncbi:MAG TPA: recombination-associated protein RdgC [Gammaproteobacteria bacterium]|nr:recombination-associated protein RdgC [Gammaproteobacteria bacterium]
MLRSIRFYLVGSAWPASEQELSDKLASAAFKPCGPYVERSSGFEPPTSAQGQLARRVGGADLIRLRSQVRVLPAGALNEALEVRLQEYRARMQEEPGRRTKRQLKEQMRDELLPKTLLRSERTSALYIAAERVLAVGSGSESRAARLVEHLRGALGGLDAKPFELARPFGELLTGVFTGSGPRELVLARECRLRDVAEDKGTVSWQNVDLGRATVQRCLEDGMELTHVGLEYGNSLRAVLDAAGVLTKLELLGQDAADLPGQDELARQDAEIALLGGTLRQLLATLRRTLDGEPAGAARRPSAPETVGSGAAPAHVGWVTA